MEQKMYEYLDSLLAKVKGKIKAEVNHIGSMGFDELNVVNTKKATQAMFDRLLAENESAYMKVARKAYKKALVDKKEEDLTPDWLMGVLLGYNLVTGYIYDREAERKRLRLNEQILTAREFSDRLMLRDSLRRTANLWWTQTSQYGIDVVDAAVLRAYRRNGVTKVRWVTAKDEKTCVECRGRSDKIYKISEIPPKTHYGCRCYFVPADEEE